MCNPLAPLLVLRLRSTLHLTPVNVSWAEQLAQIPLHPRHSGAMIHRRPLSLPAATLLLEPVVLVNRVFLCGHLLCANPGLMSLPHQHPPNLVSSHSAHFTLYILLTLLAHFHRDISQVTRLL